MFAKLFETEIGQVLVKIDSGEDGAEVRVYCEPKGFGVCSLALTWKDDDEETQWDKAELAFEKLTEDDCVKLMMPIIDKLRKCGGE